MNAKAYKQQLLDQLYAPYKKCLQCPLGSLGRTNVVFGQGNPDAALMFIGEGPGQDEDRQGKPFVGRSGKLLNTIFDLLHVKREDVFITNIVKCRPPNNRKPLPNESNTCKNLLLLKQIKIIQPKIICTLGSSALQGLLDNYDEIKITKIHGKPIEHAFKGTTIIPAYHPAYVLRNPKEFEALFSDIEKAFKFAQQEK
jgi:uracil-DNA glycosylase family 4